MCVLLSHCFCYHSEVDNIFTYHNDARRQCVRKSFLFSFLYFIITYYRNVPLSSLSSSCDACAFVDSFFIHCCDDPLQILGCVISPTHTLFASPVCGWIKSRQQLSSILSSCSKSTLHTRIVLFIKLLLSSFGWYFCYTCDCGTRRTWVRCARTNNVQMQPIARYWRNVSYELHGIELAQLAQRQRTSNTKTNKNCVCAQNENENQPFPFTVENYHQNHIPFDMNFLETTGTCQVVTYTLRCMVVVRCCCCWCDERRPSFIVCSSISTAWLIAIVFSPLRVYRMERAARECVLLTALLCSRSRAPVSSVSFFFRFFFCSKYFS